MEINSNNRWLSRVLASIVMFGLIIYIGKGFNGSDESELAAVTSDSIKTDTSTTQLAASTHASLKVKLPDGVELNAFKGGIEDQLVSFLNNPSTIAGKDVWFDFDNLNFKIGSLDITDSSIVQVKNITAILKAYPKLKIKIGGYTDKTGDSISNLKLSQNRATAVMAALKTAGANAAQIVGAEGYGSQYAKASADAPDDQRKMDRRISLGVRAK